MAIFLLIFNAICASSLWIRNMLAGKTAINRRISPIEDCFLYLVNKPNPNKISKKPLISTNS